MNETLVITECAEGHHDWQRAPDRDLLQGDFVDGRTKLYSRAVLVFYCTRCLTIEKREITVGE